MFVCTKCGSCCRNIDRIPELKKYDPGDGVCIHLTENNLCDIYYSRPDICNVDKMYERKYKWFMTRKEYDRLNSEGCEKLQNGFAKK